MTKDQFNQLQMAACDFDSAMRDYELSHDGINLGDNDLANLIEAAVRMMQGIRALPVPPDVNIDDNDPIS